MTRVFLLDILLAVDDDRAVAGELGERDAVSGMR
jgi:hypothetical protein